MLRAFGGIVLAVALATVVARRPAAAQRAPTLESAPTAVGGGPRGEGALLARASVHPRAAPERVTREGTHELRLRSGPFPGTPHPNALVYVPAGIERAAPLHVVVFIHGWNGCARVVAASEFGACRPGGRRRVSLSLIEQARASRAGAVLVVPQMAMDRQSSDPGTFREEGGFRRFLAEVLAQMAPELGAHSVDGLARVIVASHSGGYITVLDVLERGGVPIDEVAMFDSLYQYHWHFARWINAHAARFDPASPRPMRFVSLHRGGGTGGETSALWRAVRRSFEGRSGVILRRARAAPLTAAEARAPIVLARVPGDHAQAARWNLREVLEGADVPRLP